MNGQCPSCGLRLAATVLAAGGLNHCPRCGDPLASPDGATVTVAPAEPEATGGSTAAPGSMTAAHNSSAPAPPVRLPSIPGYEVLEVIGRGGMGVVYKAHQLSPRRVVALKMILGGGARAERFQLEVAAVARLQHPNVVRIHEVGEIGGRPYFSMEFVPGGSLAKHLDSGPLSTRDAAQVVSQIARAVQHAHDRGIVHRDLKPANILLQKEEGGTTKEGAQSADSTSADSAFLLPPSMHPKVADFGLAKYLEGSADGSGPQTQSGAILGTPNYMAPEQAKGKSKAIGPGTDVWALGAILYECLTGRPPFREDSQLDTLMKVISEDPAAPRQLRPAVPRDLEIICLKCLRKEPKERYTTAAAVAEDLDRFLDGRPIAARARTTRERVVGWARRRREYLSLAVGAALVIAVAIAVLAWPSRSRPTPPRFDSPPEVGTNLPSDLQIVPPNSLAFATVRVADLWANPATRDLIDHQVKLRNTQFTLDQFGQDIESKTSIHPNNIERATFVALEEEGRGWDTLIVLATVQPYSHDRLREMLTKGGKHLPQQAGGLTVYIPASKNDMAFLPFSDRVLVLGYTKGVWNAANKPENGVGALTPILQRAAEGHTLVVGFRPTQEMVREGMGQLRLGPTVAPVASLRTIGLTIAVTTPQNGRVTIGVGGSVSYPSPEQAEQAQPHLSEVIRTLIGVTESVPELLVFAQALDPLPRLVKAATWSRTGDTLSATASAEIDIATVKTQLEGAFLHEKSGANMRRIASAMRQYHDKYGRFPPAVVTDAAGKPLYSWRVLLLPYLDGGQAVYRRFHLNRPWDHPSNKPLLDQMPAVFAAPDAKLGGNATPYQVLTGAGGLFDTPDGRGMTEITDGPARTILFVEAPNAVPWTQPTDVLFDPVRVSQFGAGKAGFNVVMADGAVHHISHPVAPARLRGLFTRAGGEMALPP